MAEFQDLIVKYGDIMSINLLGKTYVILNSTELLREAFVKKGESFTGKPLNEFFIMKEASENNIATLEGDLLKLHQKLFNIYATEAGMGKSEFENVIRNLLDDFVKLAKEKKSEAINYYEQCTHFVSNVMSALVMNKHLEKDHPLSKKINEFAFKFLEVIDNFVAFMSGPLVQIYVNLKHNFLRGFKQCKKDYFDEIQKIIDERLQTFDE
ncbi:cytochrome P450 2U1-like protein, partial [Leptotrombidium deliense]